MPSLEELVQIGAAHMTNPAYIGLVIMLLMQYVGKGLLASIREAITRRTAENWPSRSVVINAFSLLLCLLTAVAFKEPDTQIRVALLRGIIALPFSIGEYELLKNVFGALGYKWH